MRQMKINQSITTRSDLSLDRYLADINHLPLITADEEVELTQAMKRGGRMGESARKKLISANLRFVVSVAKQYQHQGVPLPDLINKGNIGLMTAVERFDDTRGFKFISYAIWWIRQSILNAICEQGSMIRKPLNQIGLQNRIRHQVNCFVQKHQRYPSEDELSELLEIDSKKIRQAQQSESHTSSIDSPVGEDESMTMAEILVSGAEFSTDRLMESESLNADITQVISSLLKQNERQIIIQSFGIGCVQRSLSDIGDELGLTRERVRQIRERSLERIRKSTKTRPLIRYLG